ncbi:M23 family metallopeptidase [Microbacterium sp. X-17]|uniref:murein hydrolase activator EnvC family protein n=1 Tax=Microbacterium sp. X-17 TaxID=3144404 RepID=UPI0031F5B588
MKRVIRVAGLVVALALTVGGIPAAASVSSPEAPGARATPGDAVGTPSWAWPLDASRVSRPYLAPVHPYGPGHRGIDLTPLGPAIVRAPDAGVIAYSGRVFDRGILTIDHGGGLVSTLEPVTSELLVGARVERGQPLGTIGSGGHVAGGELHLGARRDGEYVNPVLFLGGIPRAVLLPCCGPLP